jgi:6-phosphogluconolactonase
MTRRTDRERRRFVHAAVTLPVCGALLVPWLSADGGASDETGGRARRSNRSTQSSALPPLSPSPPHSGQPRFAYVGTSCEASSGGSGDDSNVTKQARCGIHVFAVTPDRWRHVQLMHSEQPSFLALHPSQRFLYATNQIDAYQGRAAGSVEAYAIHPRDGRLSFLNRQQLSLSGTRPSHAAIAPDGRTLVVALSGGGAYDVVPIDADGRLGNVSGILKETGCGPVESCQRSAHPQMVLFDPAGKRVLSADLGTDRLSVLALADGRLTVCARVGTSPGSGPRALALHPGGRWLYALNELDATIGCYRYDARLSVIGRKRDTVFLASPSDAAPGSASTFALHPSGQFLYAAYSRAAPDAARSHRIVAFRVNPGSGELTRLPGCIDGLRAPPRAMTHSPDGASLYVMNQLDNDISHLTIDPTSGALALPGRTATVYGPTSLVFSA